MNALSNGRDRERGFMPNGIKVSKSGGVTDHLL